MLPGKDVYSYEARLKKLRLSKEPLKPVWPGPRPTTLARLIANSSSITSNPEDRVAEALLVWNAAHAATYIENQARTVVRGLLHFQVQEWQRHVGSLIIAIMRGRSSESADDDAAVPKQLGVAATLEAARLVERYWVTTPKTNGFILRSIFFRTSDFGPVAACKALDKLLQFSKANPLPPEAIYRDDEIRAQRSRPLPGEGDATADEFDYYGDAVLDAWDPLFGGVPEATWRVLELLRLKISHPTSFFDGTELGEDPLVARWLAVEAHPKNSAKHSRP